MHQQSDTQHQQQQQQHSQSHRAGDVTSYHDYDAYSVTSTIHNDSVYAAADATADVMSQSLRQHVRTPINDVGDKVRLASVRQPRRHGAGGVTRVTSALSSRFKY